MATDEIALATAMAGVSLVKEDEWTQEEMDGTDKSWSLLQPSTWWYGGYVPAGQEPPPRRELPGQSSINI